MKLSVDEFDEEKRHKSGGKDRRKFYIENRNICQLKVFIILYENNSITKNGKSMRLVAS